MLLTLYVTASHLGFEDFSSYWFTLTGSDRDYNLKQWFYRHVPDDLEVFFLNYNWKLILLAIFALMNFIFFSAFWPMKTINRFSQHVWKNIPATVSTLFFPLSSWTRKWDNKPEVYTATSVSSLVSLTCFQLYCTFFLHYHVDCFYFDTFSYSCSVLYYCCLLRFLPTLLTFDLNFETLKANRRSSVSFLLIENKIISKHFLKQLPWTLMILYSEYLAH